MVSRLSILLQSFFPTDTQGCLVTYADKRNVWILHDDHTYNWIHSSYVTSDCINKATVVNSVIFGKYHKRHNGAGKYNLGRRSSAIACENEGCQGKFADTYGCLITNPTKNYVWIWHPIDQTRNWIHWRHVTPGCIDKALVVDDYIIDRIRKRHNGQGRYNMDKSASAIACQNKACPGRFPRRLILLDLILA